MLTLIKRNYFLLTSIFLIFYFAFNLVSGERGFFSYNDKKYLLSNLKNEEMWRSILKSQPRWWRKRLTSVGFKPTPMKTTALTLRLRPLCHDVCAKSQHNGVKSSLIILHIILILHVFHNSSNDCIVWYLLNN